MQYSLQGSCLALKTRTINLTVSDLHLLSIEDHEKLYNNKIQTIKSRQQKCLGCAFHDHDSIFTLLPHFLCSA